MGPAACKFITDMELQSLSAADPDTHGAQGCIAASLVAKNFKYVGFGRAG
uniref:Uncharacterized protein n=1 Tax=Nelumbo nucifera TaxID=4432 RepID=A0A822ZT92_NELNU|nr:TPA_asm: hypothetical protein HUJ06_018080 [Nelumbo nucifera]